MTYLLRKRSLFEEGTKTPVGVGMVEQGYGGGGMMKWEEEKKTVSGPSDLLSSRSKSSRPSSGTK